MKSRLTRAVRWGQRQILAVVFLFIALSNCASPQEPQRWVPAEPYMEISPPLWYKEVWDSTARCVSQTIELTGYRFEQIHWFVVFREGFWNGEDFVLAAWSWDERIWLTESRVNLKWVIAHEATHAMTKLGSHPADPFDRCVKPWWKSEG